MPHRLGQLVHEQRPGGDHVVVPVRLFLGHGQPVLLPDLRNRPTEYIPHPLVLPQGRFWFRGQRCGNTGSPGLDKPLLPPRGTHQGSHVADVSPPPLKTKQQGSIHPRTQEHMESQPLRQTSFPPQPHQHFDTHIDPFCSRHKATDNRILDWIGTAKTMVPKKTQKCGNRGSPCLDMPVLGQHGGGGGGVQCSALQKAMAQHEKVMYRCVFDALLLVAAERMRRTVRRHVFCGGAAAVLLLPDDEGQMAQGLCLNEGEADRAS